MVKRRHNTLSFSIQLSNFAQNPAEVFESEVCAYLASINSYNSRCVSSIWLGAFEAVRHSMPLSLGLHAPNTYKYPVLTRLPSRLACVWCVATQATVASDASRVHIHQLGAYGHSGQSHRAYIGRPRDVLADSRASFFEYAIRGSPRAHPTLLVSPSTKRAYAVMVGVSTVRISEAPGVNIASWSSRFANTQCEAV